MKKILLVAAFAVLGSTVISCSTDDNDVESTSKNTPVFASETDYNTMFLREGDTIPVVDTLTTNQIGDPPGPGDDPIVVPPPPPPKP
jgi:hypothetical protein